MERRGNQGHEGTDAHGHMTGNNRKITERANVGPVQPNFLSRQAELGRLSPEFVRYLETGDPLDVPVGLDDHIVSLLQYMHNNNPDDLRAAVGELNRRGLYNQKVERVLADKGIFLN